MSTFPVFFNCLFVNLVRTDHTEIRMKWKTNAKFMYVPSVKTRVGDEDCPVLRLYGAPRTMLQVHFGLRQPSDGSSGGAEPSRPRPLRGSVGKVGLDTGDGRRVSAEVRTSRQFGLGGRTTCY